MRPYSTAVAPDSFLRKAESADIGTLLLAGPVA
jgi:hypothetical protein